MCENKKKASEYDRILRLAKVSAKMSGQIVAIFKLKDGTYDFVSEDEVQDREIIEYVTPY